MIKFGTSGYRGIMGEDFTEESVRKVSMALGQIIQEDGINMPKVIIGYDNRFNSRIYAQNFAEVICKYCDVTFFNIAAPSPLISWYSKEFDFGIVITASHNPFNYNGIKIFMHGSKECDDILAERIEKLANCAVADKTLIFDKEIENGKITLTTDYSAYCDSLLSFVNVEKINKCGIKILANPMHGNSADCLEYLFKKMGLKYTFINREVDPYFEHKLPAPYVQNLHVQSKQVVEEKFDLGVALDGDGDRFTLIDASGKIYDCNYVICALYEYFLNFKGKKGGVIKNFALTHLVEVIAEQNGQKAYLSKNGFKHMPPIFEKTDAFIGAESNGIAFKENIMSKDGIFAVVAVIDMIVSFKKSFKEIIEDIQEKYGFESEIIEFAYPVDKQKQEYIKKTLFDDKKYPKFDRTVAKIDDLEGCKIVYEGGYWGMYRFSGNEPVIRIFSEMRNLKECMKMISCYEKFIDVKEKQ